MLANLANMAILANSCQIINLCKSVPNMVASHVGETCEYCDFGEYGDFGEFLSNRQIYVNQFHTWWPATHYFTVYSLFMQYLCWLKEQ